MLLDQLHAAGALTGDHLLVVIGRDIHLALFLRRFFPRLFRFQGISRYRHHFAAQRADGFQFDRCRCFRGIYRHADSRQFACQRHRLTVITAGSRDYPALTLLVI
ncbi:hypothetical protein D3C80_1196160 [compost metagenome]